jgi:hypothetical protein
MQTHDELRSFVHSIMAASSDKKPVSLAAVLKRMREEGLVFSQIDVEPIVLSEAAKMMRSILFDTRPTRANHVEPINAGNRPASPPRPPLFRS